MMMPKVSLVFPVWNEAQNLEPLYDQVRDACRAAQVEYELVFVDNGSTDESLEVIKRLRRSDPGVRYVSLARNFGHQGALFAGMCYSRGQAVITMDADLQHPPALLPQMIALWRQGVEVVYTTKHYAHLSWTRRLVVTWFYRIISTLSGLQLDFGLSDFRLVDRKVADVIVQIPEYHKFLRGQVKWVGFRQQGLVYDVAARYSGHSKFETGHLFSLALDGLFAFSRYPLRVVALVGVIVAVLSCGYILFEIGLGAARLLHVSSAPKFPPGWATLAVAIFFLGSLQLVVLGILGEYLGRVYDQVKGRPVFIVRDCSDGPREETSSSGAVRRAGQPAAAGDQ